jgi:S1-C subfamily serine protease
LHVRELIGLLASRGVAREDIVVFASDGTDPPQRRATLDLASGAVTVTRVLPDSPAARAGLTDGDIVLGPPGEHFSERNQIREWIMTSIVDQTRSLDVLRDGRVLTFSIRISAAPAVVQ